MLPAFTGRSEKPPTVLRRLVTGALTKWIRPNAREAMREAELDYSEGADILMVKPATVYLDILKMVRDRFDVPLACISCVGEYA
jgi:hypothetical protein